MRRIFTASLLLTISIAAGQEGARRERILPAPAEGQAAAAQGIEKTDIRALIVYPENVYSPADVQRMEAAAQGIVDQIASGAKLTKADAARQAAPIGDTGLLQRIESGLRGNRRVSFLAITAAPSSAGNKPIACPPPGCGCDQHGHGVSCFCTLLNDKKFGPFCLCMLCFEKVELSWYPEPDLRMTGPPRGPLPTPLPRVLVLVAAPPDASAQTRQRLADAAVKIIQTEPWPAGLVIKTKSTPL